MKSSEWAVAYLDELRKQLEVGRMSDDCEWTVFNSNISELNWLGPKLL